MHVGKKLCKKNSRLIRRIILGILFHVLLVSSLLVVNGYFQLSCGLMAHLTDIKQGW